MRPPRPPRSIVEFEQVDELLDELAAAGSGADRRAVLLAADQADVATALVVCQREQCREPWPMRLQDLVRHVVNTESRRGWPPPPGPPLHEPRHLRRATGSEYAAFAAESE